MKTRLLALASTAAIGLGSNVAVAANNDVSGFVTVNLGATWADYESPPTYAGQSSTAFVFGGAGRVNAWLDRDMSIQLDVDGEATTNIETGSGSGDDGRVSGIFAAHLSWRNPKEHLIGVFGGFSGVNNLDYDGSMTHGIIGVEGQYYCDQWTLYGQAGYMPLMSDSDDYEPDGLLFGRAVVRYFLNPNDRLQGEFGYGNADVNGNDGDFDIMIWGAAWDHRWQGTPFSAGISYNGFNSERDSNWAEEHVVQATFTIHFGDDSLQDQDRNGATLDVANFERAFAWTWFVGR